MSDNADKPPRPTLSIEQRGQLVQRKRPAGVVVQTRAPLLRKPPPPGRNRRPDAGSVAAEPAPKPRPLVPGAMAEVD